MTRAVAPPARRTASLFWLQGLVCGAVLTFATPTALVLGVVLAPSVLALALDREPGRPVARAVAMAEMAFTLGPLWRLWVGGHSMNVARDLLLDPATICPAWLAAACSWACCELFPVGLRVLADMRAARRRAVLTAEEAALRAEWDLPV